MEKKPKTYDEEKQNVSDRIEATLSVSLEELLVISII